jgi:chromatin remodeling complex protein RSC6
MNNEIQDTNYDSIINQFSTINDSLTLFKMQINSIQKLIKTVECDVKKTLNSVKKEKKKEQDKPKNKRNPSGFAKPTKVSKELCNFIDKPEGFKIARTEVTKLLTKYIKDNNLIETSQGKKNKIIPDEKLKTLLGICEADTINLNYFNMQKYMNKHFYSKNNATEEDMR